ncbi:hypothetical protein HID58_077621 [Brassica napus]|uniref:Uncharacterized protein n=1 Tax=Brassica napus TaxID=3708 RepID=A0ABQ7YRZ7_BRANA|nr:hypothetical protein HID58_077621 [Brassica napus]
MVVYYILALKFLGFFRAVLQLMLLILWFVIKYLNIDTSGRHVRKRSSDRVGEAANQHEKNIWLPEATKLVLMCTYLMLAIHGFFQEAIEQRVFMNETQENTLDSQNINNKFNVKNYLNLVSGGRRGSVVT